MNYFNDEWSLNLIWLYKCVIIWLLNTENQYEYSPKNNTPAKKKSQDRSDNFTYLSIIHSILGYENYSVSYKELLDMPLSVVMSLLSMISETCDDREAEMKKGNKGNDGKIVNTNEMSVLDD